MLIRSAAVRQWSAARAGNRTKRFVGAAGFEPATTSTQSSCTTGLCDAPFVTLARRSIAYAIAVRAPAAAEATRVAAERQRFRTESIVIAIAHVLPPSF